MTDKELKTKRTMLRAALLGMEAKGELHRVANATGIVGGVETLKKMIADENDIHIVDIGMIGMHFGIYIGADLLRVHEKSTVGHTGF